MRLLLYSEARPLSAIPVHMLLSALNWLCAQKGCSFVLFHMLLVALI